MSKKKTPFIACSLKTLPEHQQLEAAQQAIAINPVNAPPSPLHPQRIAVMTSKYWGSGGVHLTVGWLDNPEPALRARILSHMNAWSAYANVRFTDTGTREGQVRIARAADGYWSYLGTDILSIPPNQPTMNLQAFTMQTPESEFHRVVRHEVGHTLGAPHEHMRVELVNRIDPAKAKAYFLQMDGWNAQTVTEQVLTPVPESSLMATVHAEQDSVMCYQLPASITTDGKPIVGGTDITANDGAFMGKVYPLLVQPPTPTPTPTPTPVAVHLLTLTFPQTIPVGGLVRFNTNKQIPAGTYTLDPKPAALDAVVVEAE